MQAIRQTQQLNKAELEKAVPPEASWHRDYKDTAYIYIGGLPLDLSEGDVVTIFSQYGHPTHLNMIRDRETGKSKGFAFLKYEDQRSCDLAVDNLGGAEVLGRLLRVDHTRYKKKDDEDEETYRIDKHEQQAVEVNGNGKRSSDGELDSDGDTKRKTKKPKRMLKEEKELEEMLRIKENGEEEDPMREYLISEKKREVEEARARDAKKEKRHKHRHRHRDDDMGSDEERDRRRKHRHPEDDGELRERHRDHDHKHRTDVRGVDKSHREPRSRHGQEEYSDEEPSWRYQRRSRDQDSPGRRRRSRSPGDRQSKQRGRDLESDRNREKTERRRGYHDDIDDRDRRRSLSRETRRHRPNDR